VILLLLTLKPGCGRIVHAPNGRIDDEIGVVADKMPDRAPQKNDRDRSSHWSSVLNA